MTPSLADEMHLEVICFTSRSRLVTEAMGACKDGASVSLVSQVSRELPWQPALNTQEAQGIHVCSYTTVSFVLLLLHSVAYAD